MGLDTEGKGETEQLLDHLFRLLDGSDNLSSEEDRALHRRFIKEDATSSLAIQAPNSLQRTGSVLEMTGSVLERTGSVLKNEMEAIDEEMLGLSRVGQAFSSAVLGEGESGGVDSGYVASVQGSLKTQEMLAARYEQTVDTLLIHKAKREIVDILTFMWHMHLDLQIDRVISKLCANNILEEHCRQHDQHYRNTPEPPNTVCWDSVQAGLSLLHEEMPRSSGLRHPAELYNECDPRLELGRALGRLVFRSHASRDDVEKRAGGVELWQRMSTKLDSKSIQEEAEQLMTRAREMAVNPNVVVILLDLTMYQRTDAGVCLPDRAFDLLTTLFSPMQCLLWSLADCHLLDGDEEVRDYKAVMDHIQAIETLTTHLVNLGFDPEDYAPKT